MTECERLIANGTFTRDFFKPEVICDFQVDEKRKKIWAIELDLVLQLDRVCKKYNLRYWLMYGSLLGAIRHKGIIPWDDDMDVMMPREDHDKLMSLAYEFTAPYFLQTPQTDHGYYYSYNKLRNSNATGLEKVFRYQPYNHGIGLDIFTLDTALEDEKDQRRDLILPLIKDNSNFMRRSNPLLDEKNRQRADTWSGRNPREICAEIAAIAIEYDARQSEFCANVPVTVYGYPKSLFHKADFAELIDINLYGYNFPIPAGYERILTTIYGDYKQFPPVEQRGQWHDRDEFDPDTPFELFLAEKYGINFQKIKREYHD